MSAEPRPVLDPLFEGALRKALAQRVVATKPKHSRRRVVLGGALALALAGGGVAVAEQLDALLSAAEQVIFVREHLYELPLRRYRPAGDPLRYVRALLYRYEFTPAGDPSGAWWRRQ